MYRVMMLKTKVRKIIMKHMLYVVVCDFKIVCLGDFSFLSNILYNKQFIARTEFLLLTYTIFDLLLYL